MKFGLYTAMGKQTCGKFAASCGHEALDAKTYAVWGVVSHAHTFNCCRLHTAANHRLPVVVLAEQPELRALSCTPDKSVFATLR